MMFIPLDPERSGFQAGDKTGKYSSQSKKPALQSGDLTGFAVIYHHLVVSEDIPKLSSDWKLKIRRAIEQRLTTRPEAYGKPLRRSLKGYWKLRVGDYRIIYRIEQKTVKVLVIQHRSVVYTALTKRL